MYRFGGAGGLFTPWGTSSQRRIRRESQQGYVMVLRDYLPPELRG